MSDGYPLMEAWVRDRMFTQGQMDEALRIGEFTGFESFVLLKKLVDDGMPPSQAMDEVRRRMREDGLIPLNREI